MDEIAETVVETGRNYDVLMDLLIAFGIALNIYLVLDLVTDGGLTEQVKDSAKNAGRSMAIWYGVQRDKLTVLEHATDIIESNAE